MLTRFPMVAKIKANERSEKTVVNKNSTRTGKENDSMFQDFTSSRPIYKNSDGIRSAYGSGNTPSIYTGNSYVLAYRGLPDSQTLDSSIYLGAVTKSSGKADRNTFGRYGNADSLKGKVTLNRRGFDYLYGARNSHSNGRREDVGIGGLSKLLALEQGGLSYNDIRYRIGNSVGYGTLNPYNGFHGYSTYGNPINQMGKSQQYGSLKQSQTFVHSGESGNINGRQQEYDNHILNYEYWKNNHPNSGANYWISPYHQQGSTGDNHGYFYSRRQGYDQDNNYWLQHRSNEYDNTGYSSSSTALNENYATQSPEKYLGPPDFNKYYPYKIISKSIPGYGNFQRSGLTDRSSLKHEGGSNYANKEIHSGYETSGSYLARGQETLGPLLKENEMGSEYGSIIGGTYTNNEVDSSGNFVRNVDFYSNSGMDFGAQNRYSAELSPERYGMYETYSYGPQGFYGEGYNQYEHNGSTYGKNYETFNTNLNQAINYGSQADKETYPHYQSQFTEALF